MNIASKLKDPKVIALLAWPFYVWLKALCLTRFGYSFLPETDTLVQAALTAFGLGAAVAGRKVDQ